MESILKFSSFSPTFVLNSPLLPYMLSSSTRTPTGDPSVAKFRRCIAQRKLSRSLRPASLPSSAANAAATSNSQPPRDGHYTVGDFMTGKEDLHIVKPTTKVGEALEMLVEKRVTGLPVIDDDWNLVGVVSDYDLLALDSISGTSQADTNLFPDVDSTWTTFNEVQKLLSKTNGKVVGDVMTPTPLSVRENTNLEDAARLLLQTKYRRLPVVDVDGKLVGIITRGNVVRAALQIKRTIDSQ
ncbi:CBS domain-containing protein CBSX1, chloroplastic [Nicotiana tabacum]|uniref:CBS domain-containing protein CBSX1, chloroplastic n=2 Tax=Nicotiana TaxID=4085 RepID=A0A1S4B1Q8_TOBAC|nr:PREDICTED: CBS domain-containing protein CBSX1, chloroplastic-like [Nicotiana sylvestris]XP_016482723.1 PREDICTED: CBS domain-containing protein CBSX1, chloroplastic-like [Nicotiana tabacum]